jgi:phage tail sheath protein FI
MAYIVDGVYNIDEQPPIEVQGVGTGVWGIVGTFSKGPVNTPTYITSLNDLKNTFGGADPTLTGYIGALTAFGQGATQCQVVRIVGSGAAAASVTIMDGESTPAQVFTATYKTVGTGGNNASITISSGTKTGTFKITVSDGDLVEVFDNVVVEQPQTPIAGAQLLSSLTSQIVDFTQPTTPNTNMPANGTFPLTGGLNGSAPPLSAYIGTTNPNTGLQALAGATPKVNLVFLAGQACADTGTVQALNDFCEANVCMAAVCDAQGTTLAQAKSDTANLDTDRIVFCWPWQQMYVDDLNQTVVVPPTGYWVGKVATLYPHQSPGNKNLTYTNGPEFPVSASDIAAALDPAARIVPIGVPIPRGGIGIRSGATLSQTPSTNPVYRRRMDDFIVESINTALGQFVDEPITSQLMTDQQHTVSAFLDPLTGPNNEAGEPMIEAYSVQCDAKNNPDSITQNDMTVIDTKVKLFNINRFLLFRTQIGAGVITTTSQQQ